MRYLWMIPVVCLTIVLASAVEAEKPLVLGSDPPALTVVTTLEELKKLDPIQVGEASLRLALEAEKVPLGSGLLVYCLWDGNGGPRNGITRREDQEKLLGPCKVRIKRIYENQDQPRIQEAVDLQKSALPSQINGDALFVAPVLPPAAGKYELTVLSSEGDLVGRARIECVHDKEAESPHWRSLTTDGAAKKTATYSPSFPKVPKWDDAVLTDLPKNLPTFFPAGDSPALKAAAAEGLITLTSPNEIWDNVAETILMRIFVNGEPTIDTAMNRQVEAMGSRAEAARVVMVTELKFTLSTRPEDYHATKDDAVEVQFLCCPYGLEDAPRQGGALREKLHMARKMNDSLAVCLSNKVLLIPGTKPKPAATTTASQPTVPQ